MTFDILFLRGVGGVSHAIRFLFSIIVVETTKTKTKKIPYKTCSELSLVFILNSLGDNEYG